MCKTHEIADQLGVTLLKRLKGAQALPVRAGKSHEPLEGGSYLVDQEGVKMVLKTGRFNPNEVDDNWTLSELGVTTRLISESVPDEYILYEYVDAPLLAAKQFWSDGNMERVFDLQAKIATGLKDRPMSEDDISKAIDWTQQKPLKTWLDEAAEAYSPGEADKIRQALDRQLAQLSNPQGLEWVYRDNNAEHYVDLGSDLVVLDPDITLRPKEYMNMRYLAWVILMMPKEKLSREWVAGWLDRLNAGPAHYLTFLISLVGILWDIHGNENTKDEHIDKTDLIKQFIDLTLDKLN